MASAHLIERTILKRVLEVTLDEAAQRPFHVTYNGRGIGAESVLVDGVVAARHGSVLWFVPRLPFRIGNHDAAVEVRVWPWFAMRSFRLIVDGETLYSEGAR